MWTTAHERTTLTTATTVSRALVPPCSADALTRERSTAPRLPTAAHRSIRSAAVLLPSSRVAIRAVAAVSLPAIAHSTQTKYTRAATDQPPRTAACQGTSRATAAPAARPAT